MRNTSRQRAVPSVCRPRRRRTGPPLSTRPGARAAPVREAVPMSNDVPIASLLRVERGMAAPEELAAIAVIIACYAHRTSRDREHDATSGAGSGSGRRRTVRPDAGCWASCWACR
ncbi:acyl-CoA carboxylase epsilon subunit [Streptomyces sp. NBC_01310]|uniref:acyl-CoA carboxylase epsilon subunit n=1 Tax=Streptomyces sp. NBC_01310 TaxID=2903820 RepID=UPI0035B64AAD